MGDLKEALGVVEPLAPAALPDGPVAKAQANTTSALVGVPVRFTSEGTRDPQELPLTLVWDFGDGVVAAGPTALHAYLAPGEYSARLSATSAAGLRDEATLSITIRPRDAAPSIAIRVLDADGAPAARALAGDALRFEAVASDPEGAPLKLDWDLGDGYTTYDAVVSHAYEAPGAYDVALRATDGAGQVVTASARVLVDGAWRAEGVFEPLGAQSADAAFAVPAEAMSVVATLTFPAGLGVNDLEIALVDAAGAEVARSDGTGAPGAEGDVERELVLSNAELAGAKSGAWTARVVREGGLQVAWTLSIGVSV